MEELGGSKIGGNKTFLSHVFSTTEESKAEILNVVQYASMGVIPIVLLNKLIQRFIPEADPESSTLEIVVEIFLQLIVMFCGMIVIHRAITFFPTYSGFKYETLTLTNVVLAFLIIVLSIQTKMGIKVNILVDRALELWNGSSYEDKRGARRNVRTSSPVSQHAHSQADYLDNSQVQSGTFPPAPVATTKQNSLMETYDNMLGGGAHRGMPAQSDFMGPMAANSLLGSNFGSF